MVRGDTSPDFVGAQSLSTCRRETTWLPRHLSIPPFYRSSSNCTALHIYLLPRGCMCICTYMYIRTYVTLYLSVRRALRAAPHIIIGQHSTYYAHTIMPVLCYQSTSLLCQKLCQHITVYTMTLHSPYNAVLCT